MQLSINIILVIITVLVSIGGFSNPKIQDDLIFYPPAVKHQNQWYRFITCGLIHADAMHLIFNMIALYSFGGLVERGFTVIVGNAGRWYYLFMYITALVVSLLPTYFKNSNNYHYRSLGASGAVSAVVFAGLMIVPEAEVGIFPIPFGIPGFIFGPLYLIITAYLDRSGKGGNINHSAHLWGALYGILFIIVVGKLNQFDAIGRFVNGIKNYLQATGWI